ncbi:adenylate/guanylate cyclase domain-containing protein [Leptospira barantonii]|uniref:Guanylate cyclase domain-containing protein n=1 Tax=Leptospira barantonii TaxID=2023184 RepID=A0ABX4NIW0_9LEPT|nr:adenylate/guanylate cyclase domain-containing protein [Leptospira barantonii]PJZ56700.1 hypothetical protein CH367_14735 [Leptospira barantonii]
MLRFWAHSILCVPILFAISCKKFSNPESSLRPVQAGVADLSGVDFETSDPVRLDGEWNFQWSTLHTPDEVRVDLLQGYTQTIDVPGSWNEWVPSGESKKVGGAGFATYFVRIRLNPSLKGKLLTFKFPHAGTAYKAWIENQEIASSGTVADTAEVMNPKYVNRTKSFLVEKEEVLLTIQVSNFHHRKGGLRFDSVYIGSEEKIQALNSQRNTYTFFLMGSLVIMSIYHFGLFFLRKEDVAAFVFGIFCFLIASRLLFVGEVWITSVFPDIDWGWMYRLEYATLYLSAPVFTAFVRFVFTEEFYKKVIYVLFPIYFALTVFVFSTKPILFSLSLSTFQGIVVLNSLYLLYVIIKAAIHKKQGAISALIGFFAFILTIANDLLYYNEFYLTGFSNLLPFGVFIFIFFQSLILSQIFSNAFQSIKNLSRNLSLTNEAYSRFVPSEFLKFLDKRSIVDIQLGDQIQKEMTILFSDIRSFTDLSERLTPKENFNFLNSYLRRVSPVIQKNGGFIDKYIGDAIMALFPESVEDSINAAVEMQREIRTYNQHRLKLNYDPIKVGIGIHSGNLMLGIIGAYERMEGTVIADSVNVASRIEGLTKVYDTAILISDTILKKVKDPTAYNYRYIDRVKVKGKSESIVIYEVHDGQPDFIVDLMNQSKGPFERGIDQYQNRNFAETISYMEKVLEINPNDTPAQIYLKRAKFYLENGVVGDILEGS